MFNEQSVRGWQSVATAAGHVCLSSEASGRLLAATHVLQKDKNQQKCGKMGVKKAIIIVFFVDKCVCRVIQPFKISGCLNLLLRYTDSAT